MKITKVENNVLNFIIKRLDIIFLMVITLLSLLIRYQLFDFQSGDYKYYLSLWMDEISKYGGFGSLKYSIGNYNVPYMVFMCIFYYLPISNLAAIKCTSVLFDIILAISSSLILGELLVKNKNVKFFQIITYVLVLFLPSVMLNGAYWGQCDSIYSAFVLLSILFLLKKKNILSFVLLGIAFSFKMQTLFVLPVYIIIYLANKNFSLINFLIIPIMNVIMCLPAILMGRGFMDTMSIYFNQATYYEHLTMNVPNIYQFIDGPYNMIYNFGILLTLSVFGAITYFVLKKSVNFDNQKIITFMLLSVLICNFFLPAMHERYLFLADVLSVIWYIFNKEKIFVPIGINLISLLIYMNFLDNSITAVEMRALSILLGFITFELFRYFIKLCNSKKDGVL